LKEISLIATRDIINNVAINRIQVEKVETVIYFDSLFTQEAEWDNNIKAKLGKGQELLSSLKTLWKSHSI